MVTDDLEESFVTLSDGARIRYRKHGGLGAAHPEAGLPVVMLHGGPGLPDYLSEVAPMIHDLTTVYRYDQRGTGGSPWTGHHTLARHVADLAELLELWGLSRVCLIGHSYGTNLACRFVLSHPELVNSMIMLAGPFLGDWRDGDRAARSQRMSAAQAQRLEELDALTERSEEQEVELLTLAWFTDHAEVEQGWEWAAQAARIRRPINWTMNSELGLDARADPLEDHLGELRNRLPRPIAMIGGVLDPRPAAALTRLATDLDVPLTLIDDAGHEPWLEQPDQFKHHLRRVFLAARSSLPARAQP